MRVYVGTTLDALSALRANGFDAPVRARAVTPSLREWYAEGDLEELEYAASADAAHDSLRLLARSPGSRQRRVVVAADVPDATVRPEPTSVDDAERSVVRLDQPVTLDQVVSMHVDDDVALADVAAAAAAVMAADGGDDDAAFVVDGADGHELLWYDVTELDDVLRLS
ncbi:MAG TPA: hypothetical protein VFL94_05250 [Actinomycetales bacterium]|nr:hypothetical protein [Actinomycetales bacterium]